LSTLEPAARLAASFSSVLRPGRFVQPVAGRLSGNRWFRRLTLEPFMVADAEALPPSAVRALFRDLRAHTDVRGAARAMGRDDPRPALGDVRCPAIVLWGARDAQLPLDDAVEHARRLGARLRVVADCGHLVIAERPAAVIDALAALALAPSS
jgi:pimeloyl-ACP methyl ester carboxylesterase